MFLYFKRIAPCSIKISGVHMDQVQRILKFWNKLFGSRGLKLIVSYKITNCTSQLLHQGFIALLRHLRALYVFFFIRKNAFFLGYKTFRVSKYTSDNICTVLRKCTCRSKTQYFAIMRVH